MTDPIASNPTPEASSRVRAFVDGELAEADRLAFERALADDPALRAQVAGERSLRESVGRVMGEVACPPALRDRVRAMLADAGESGAAQSADYSDSDPVRAVAGGEDASAGPDAPLRLDRAPARKRPGGSRRVLALAAALAVLIGGVVVLQNVAGGGAGVGERADAQLAGLPSGLQLASFMSGEHDRCLRTPDEIRKFTQRDIESVPTAFRDVLGERMTADQLLLGEARLLGAGHCRVPGDGPSVHLLYEVFDGEGQTAEVSLYIQRCDDPRFESGKAYVVGSDGQLDGSIIGWRRGELLYYIVTGKPDMTRAYADRLAAPAVGGAI